MDFSTELVRCSLCSTDPPKDGPLLFCENDHIFCNNCFKNLKQSPTKTAELDESGNTSNKSSSNNSSTGIFGTRELAQELQAFKESEQNGHGVGDESGNTTDLNFTGNTTGTDEEDSSLGILNGGILENSTTADSSSNFGSTLNGSSNTSSSSGGITSPASTPGSRILQSIQNIFSPLSSSKSKPHEKMAPIVEESTEQNGGDESCNTTDSVVEDHVEEVDGKPAVDPTCHVCQGLNSQSSDGPGLR